MFLFERMPNYTYIIYIIHIVSRDMVFGMPIWSTFNRCSSFIYIIQPIYANVSSVAQLLARLVFISSKVMSDSHVLVGEDLERRQNPCPARTCLD